MPPARAGSPLHAGLGIAPNERAKLERLCRYVSRPPVACERLALTASTLDRMARLAALVPKPRMHLTRYHGVFAPHSQHRAAVTPAQSCPGCSDAAGI